MSQRKKKLLYPRLQLGLIVTFFLLACLSAGLQWMLLRSALTDLTPLLGENGEAIVLMVSEVVRENLLIALGCLAPVMFLVGIFLTHRVAGPVYRLERHLEALARGENPGECSTREMDELQELCEHLNEAVRALKAGRAAATPPPSLRKVV